MPLMETNHRTLVNIILSVAFHESSEVLEHYILFLYLYLNNSYVYILDGGEGKKGDN